MSIATSIGTTETSKTEFALYSKSRVLEEKLIEGCKKGKRSAQTKLYNQYCKAMLNVSMRYCQSQEEAEDALQEAFLKIFKNITTFEGRHEGSLTQWIKTIVVNSALSSHRKNKKHYFNEDISEMNIADEDGFMGNMDAEESATSKEKQILTAVQELPAGYRAVFNLYVVEGYSHREIADILEISENTSKSQLSKARKYLKVTLGLD